MRADAEGEEAPPDIQGQLRLAHVVARVLVGRDRLAALARPLDGAAELSGRPQDEAVLRVLPALGPEAAPDVAGDDADLVLGDLEDVGRQRGPHAVGVLHVRIEGVTVLAGVIDA